jgi:ATP-binding cassette, subfamily F, member 1
MGAKEAKKIADKERKARERALALKAEALRDDDNVFDVSYEGMGDARATAQENATDVKVHSLTLRAKGKLLLDKTDVTIAAARRYGLVGPNGKGKSTLLRMLAKRQIPVPLGIDVMLVEQEVVADDRTALEVVVQARASPPAPLWPLRSCCPLHSSSLLACRSCVA